MPSTLATSTAQVGIGPVSTFALGAISGVLLPIASEWLRRALLDSRRLTIRCYWDDDPGMAARQPALLCTVSNARSTPVSLLDVAVLVRESGQRRQRPTRYSLQEFSHKRDELPCKLGQADHFTLSINAGHLRSLARNAPLDVRLAFLDDAGRTWESPWTLVEHVDSQAQAG